MATVAHGEPQKSVTQFFKEMPNRAKSAELSVGQPSRPLLGLPVKRAIPQEVHSALDYACGLVGTLNALIAETTAAKVSNAVLAGGHTAGSMLTDYRMSVAKVLPIEVHEAGDYLHGTANVLAPFVFGYYRREPLVSGLQILSGLVTVLTSLFTDYRAVKRVRWGSPR